MEYASIDGRLQLTSPLSTPHPVSLETNESVLTVDGETDNSLWRVSHLQVRVSYEALPHLYRIDQRVLRKGELYYYYH